MEGVSVEETVRLLKEALDQYLDSIAGEKERVSLPQSGAGKQ